MTDDPQILTHAVRETPVSVLFNPHAYRYLSSSSFTPLQTISFDFDHSLAGTNPRFFYAHQIAAVAIVALLMFLLVERWGGLAGGWLAAATFLVAPQTVFAARSLMLRHYVEGLLFSIVALLLWRREKHSAWIDIASAIAYLLAMLCKEFYAPLPLLLLVVAIAQRLPLRDLVLRMIPHAVAAAVFIGWRTAMLGSVGGYGGGTMGSGVATLPSAVWKAIVGSASGVVVGIAAAVLFAIAASALLRSPRASIAYVAFATIFLALPLIAVANDFQFRYAFTSCAVIAAAAGLSIDAKRRWTALAPVALLAIVAVTGFAEARRLPHEMRQMVAEGKYVWAQPANAAPLLAYSPGWYLTGLEWLRMQELHERAPLFVLSAEGVFLRGLDPQTVVTSHPDEDSMKRLEPGAVAVIEADRARLDTSVPLTLAIERRSNDVRWVLGPSGGSFQFLSLPYYDDVRLPPEGWRRQPEPVQRELFRIRRDLPDGRWTLSPPLLLPRDGETVRWSSTGQGM